MHSLYGKHFLKLADLSTEEVASLVDLAAELKAADMVKLPLRVVTRHPSQKDQLLADA